MKKQTNSTNPGEGPKYLVLPFTREGEPVRYTVPLDVATADANKMLTAMKGVIEARIAGSGYTVSEEGEPITSETLALTRKTGSEKIGQFCVYDARGKQIGYVQASVSKQRDGKYDATTQANFVSNPDPEEGNTEWLCGVVEGAFCNGSNLALTSNSGIQDAHALILDGTRFRTNDKALEDIGVTLAPKVSRYALYARPNA
jgi:hypothetical protein